MGKQEDGRMRLMRTLHFIGFTMLAWVLSYRLAVEVAEAGTVESWLFTEVMLAWMSFILFVAGALLLIAAVTSILQSTDLKLK